MKTIYVVTKNKQVQAAANTKEKADKLKLKLQADHFKLFNHVCSPEWYNSKAIWRVEEVLLV